MGVAGNEALTLLIIMNTYIKVITLRGACASQFNVSTVRVSSRRIHTDDQHDLGTWELVASRIFDALQRRKSIKEKKAQVRYDDIMIDRFIERELA